MKCLSSNTSSNKFYISLAPKFLRLTELLLNWKDIELKQLQEWITTLELQKSDLEQYGRRVCIRAGHLSVESEKTADSIYEKTGEFLKEACPVVLVSCIDWAHHIGSECNSYRNKKNNCSIIVRFTSSRRRIMFYRNTKLLKDVRIKLNLTKRKKVQI